MVAAAGVGATMLRRPSIQVVAAPPPPPATPPAPPAPVAPPRAAPETVRVEVPVPVAPPPPAPVPPPAGASVNRLADRRARLRALRRGERPSNTVTAVDAAPPSERAQVEATVAAFATAFKSRDLSRVRRVYPGMTPQQAQEWGTFFMDARNLDVRLAIASFDPQGDQIVAELTGGLDWESLKSGRAESRTVAYRATFARDKTGWTLTGIRGN
jgi:hypothetical protein